MKKLLLTCTLLLAIVGVNAPDAEAQMCFKFVSFCDGIQIDSIVNDSISAQWYHFDCANNVPMTSGSKGETPVSNACPGGNPTPAGLISCMNCGGFGDWHFVVDTPIGNGTLDMVSGNNPGGSCWIDELAYTVQLGACTGIQNGAGPKQARNRPSYKN